MIIAAKIKGRIYGQDYNTLELFPSLEPEHENAKLNKKTSAKFLNKDINKASADSEKSTKAISNTWVTIFGENGSGKSTFSHAMWDYATNSTPTERRSDCVVELHPANGVDKDHIYVFNDDFKSERVRFSENENLEAIVMLDHQGATQDEIDEKIKELSENKEKLQKSDFLLGDILRNDDDSYKNIEPYPETIKKIERELKKKLKNWAHLDSILKKNKIDSKIILENFVKEYEAHKKEITAIPDDDLEHANTALQEDIEKYKMLQDALPINEIEIIGPAKFEIIIHQINELLEQIPSSAAIQDSEIIEVIKKSPDLQATKNLLDKNTDRCSLCLQPISEEWSNQLLSAINSLSQAHEVISFQRKIENQRYRIESIQQKISGITAINHQNLINMDKFISARNDFNEVVKDAVNTLNKKINTPYAVESLNCIEDTFEIIVRYRNLCTEITKINLAIKDNNLRVSKISEERERLSKKLLTIALAENKEALETYISLTDKEIEEKNMNTSIRKKINDIEVDIADLEAQMSSTHIAMDKINFALKIIFLQANRLKLVSAKNGYSIFSRGHQVSLQNLSSGEKNAIALAYYFAQPYSGHKDDDILTGDYLFILDDPITSMDRSNELGLYSMIQRSIQDIIKKTDSSSHVQVCVLTHNTSVLRACERIGEKIYKLQKSGEKYKSNIRILKNGKLTNESLSAISNYRLLINDLYTFAKAGKSDTYYSLGNEMRRALEEYSNFNFNIGGTALFTNNLVGKYLDDAVRDGKIGKDTRELIKSLLIHLWMNSDSHGSDKVHENSLEHIDTSFDEFETYRAVRLVLILLDTIHFTGLGGILYNEYLPTKIEEINTNLKSWKTEFEGDRNEWLSLLDSDLVEYTKFQE